MSVLSNSSTTSIYAWTTFLLVIMNRMTSIPAFLTTDPTDNCQNLVGSGPPAVFATLCNNEPGCAWTCNSDGNSLEQGFSGGEIFIETSCCNTVLIEANPDSSDCHTSLGDFGDYKTLCENEANCAWSSGVSACDGGAIFFEENSDTDTFCCNPVTEETEVTASPTAVPTTSPTMAPSLSPTVSPTMSPTAAPTVSPTMAPSLSPTVSPTMSPSAAPTVSPTMSPTAAPTASPTMSPTAAPTASPTMSPNIMSSTPELCSLDWLLQQCDCQDKKFNQCVSSTALECKKDLGLLKGPEFAQLQQDAKKAPCPGGRKRNLRG